MTMIRSYPVETDWDELFFMAHDLLGLTINEFLYDYNMEFLSYMLTQKIELKTGQDISEPEEKTKTMDARDLFNGLGF